MRSRCLLILPAILFFAAFTYGQTAAPDLPRYRLVVGQELTYESSMDFKAQRSSMSEGSTAVFDVVSGDEQAGWHIFGRIASWNVQNGIRQEWNKDLVAFDLKADGAAVLSPGLVPSAAVPDVFPALPRDPQQLAGQWQREMPYGAKIVYTSPAATATTFDFAGEMMDPIYRIYLIKRHLTFHFDATRGLLESWTSKDTQGYGFVGEGTSHAKLKDVKVRPQQWVEQFSRDAAVYLDAMTQYHQASRAAMDDAAKVNTLSADANKRLTTARSKITSPELMELLDKQLKTLPAQMENYVQEIHDRQAMLGQPSPQWTLRDQAGVRHSLKDYRGKVVVLDFWYRGCGWCMRAMPEIQQLARTYADKPVAVLGMNTDKDAADVKFVVDAFGLSYPILHLEDDTTTKYHVRAFPTVIVIGPDGVVRDILVGYSPDGRERLTKKIESLVARAEHD